MTSEVSARYCPVCGSWLRVFEPFGSRPRPNALCPVCGCLERHRLVWIFFEQKTNFFDGAPKSMLHISPGKKFEKRFKQIAGLDYLSAGLTGNYMVKMDIIDIQYADNSFDAVYCSHVLEHIPDDRKAMREMHRVLKVGGWAIIMVPIRQKGIPSDPLVTDPVVRKRVYGQSDHVRVYGPDIKYRLEEAGFTVMQLRPPDIVDAEDIVRFGLKEDEIIFVCQKK